MAKPLTDAERQQIADAIRTGKARNEIARQFGRSASTITAIARDHGLTFDRSATKSATEARQVDLAARRADLQALLLEDAHRLRRQLWEPCVERKAMSVSLGQNAGSRVEIVDIHHDQPPFVDQQRIVTSAAIAVDKVIAIDRHDHDNREGEFSAVDEWLRGIMGDTDTTVAA